MDLLCPLISGRCNGRVNDGYSTMSDGIFDGIFPIVHRTFLLSYFRGCWLLDFSCAQSMWTYNEAAIELAAAVFCNIYLFICNIVIIYFIKYYKSIRP